MLEPAKQIVHKIFIQMEFPRVLTHIADVMARLLPFLPGSCYPERFHTGWGL